jgi:hypothetical protein
MKQPTTQENNPKRPTALAEARGSAAKRAREVLLYCKLWTEGDVGTLHLRPERKVLEHRIRVIAEAIQMLDALPPNDGTQRPGGPTNEHERDATDGFDAAHG